MSKRNVATALWFLMGWTAGSVLAVMFNLTPTIGILMGFPFAAAVRYGPLGKLWTPEPQSRIRPADEVAAELDRKAGAPRRAKEEQASS